MSGREFLKIRYLKKNGKRNKGRERECEQKKLGASIAQRSRLCAGVETARPGQTVNNARSSSLAAAAVIMYA